MRADPFSGLLLKIVYLKIHREGGGGGQNKNAKFAKCPPPPLNDNSLDYCDITKLDSFVTPRFPLFPFFLPKPEGKTAAFPYIPKKMQ